MQPFKLIVPLLSLCAVAALLVIATVSLIVDPHEAPLSFLVLGLTVQQIAGLGLKELREHAGKVLQRMKELRDGYQARLKEGKAGNDLWPENTRDEWKQVNEEYDACETRMKALKEEADIVAREAQARDWMNRSCADEAPNRDAPAGPETQRTYGDLGLTREEALAYQRNQRDRHLAFQAWAATEIADQAISDEMRQACQRLNFQPSVRTLSLRLLANDEYSHIQRALRAVVHDQVRRDVVVRELLDGRGGSRALSGFAGPSGGYIVAPPRLVTTIEIAMIQFGAILQVADTITTETGEDMQWPYVDDTSNEGTYIGENEDAQAAGEPNPSFEQVIWRAWDLSSKFIKVPFNLQRDSLINVDTLIGRLIGERIGRKLSGEATTGTHKIRGIVTRAAAGNTAAASAAVTYDDLVKLETSLDAGWEPAAQYMFHKNVLEQLRLLKDGNGTTLWVSNMQVGAPPTLNGKPYTINQKMASTIGAGAKTVLYGDLSQYKIRRVGPSLQLVRLVERFAEYRQTGYIGYLSADGNLLRPNNATSCPVKYLIQP